MAIAADGGDSSMLFMPNIVSLPAVCRLYIETFPPSPRLSFASLAMRSV